MKEKPEDMAKRTTSFALRVIKMVESLPKSYTADVLGRQVLRSATSVGANYRAARRARSRKEFCSKLGIVEEEADECAYWFELIVKSGLLPESKLGALRKEIDEIIAIIVSSIVTAKKNRARGEVGSRNSEVSEEDQKNIKNK